MSRTLVVAIVAAGGMSAVVAATSGGQSSNSTTSQSTTTFSVVSRTVSVDVAETGAAGPSRGDLVVIRDRLLRGGRQIGRDTFTCIGTDGDLQNGSAECTGTFVLPGGRLQIQGEAVTRGGASSARGAVTGGTGRYFGVRGSWSISGATPEEGVVRFRLLSP